MHYRIQNNGRGGGSLCHTNIFFFNLCAMGWVLDHTLLSIKSGLIIHAIYKNARMCTVTSLFHHYDITMATDKVINIVPTLDKPFNSTIGLATFHISRLPPLRVRLAMRTNHLIVQLDWQTFTSQGYPLPWWVTEADNEDKPFNSLSARGLAICNSREGG